MTSLLACEKLHETLGSLFECSEHGDYQRIHTPFIYPDGDSIALFCKFTGDTVVVSDFGETIRWLRMQTAAPRRSQKQRMFIEDICQTHGVEFHRGMLLAHARQDDVFADVVTRVCQAAMRVSDLWFTLRTRAVESATDDVAEFLTDRQISFERGKRLAGKSGRQYAVDFLVTANSLRSLINVLSTGSKSAARAIVDHVFTSWSDLGSVSSGVEQGQFVSLFDDTSDVWSDEDFRLVDGISRLALMSKMDSLEEALTIQA